MVEFKGWGSTATTETPSNVIKEVASQALSQWEPSSFLCDSIALPVAE